MKIKFKRIKLQNQLILIFITMAVLPIILISSVSYVVYYNSIMSKTDAFVEQTAEQHKIKLETQLKQYTRILYNMVVDTELISLGEAISGDSTEGTYGNDIASSKIKMRNKFQEYSKTDTYISSIFFLSTNDDYCDYSKRMGNSNDKLWSNNNLRQSYYGQVMEKKTLTFLPTANISLYQNYGVRDEYSFCIAFPLRDIYRQGKKASGAIYLAINESALRPYIGDNVDFSGKTGVETLVLNANDIIISSTDNKDLTCEYTDYINKKDNKTKIIQKRTIIDSPSHWSIVNVIDKSVYYRDISAFTMIVLVFAALVTFCFLWLIIIIMRRYSLSIKNIASGIKKYAHGDKNVNVEIDEDDDLYTIANQFNEMTHLNNALVETLVQKNVTIKKAVNRRKKAEIKALEAQINPHFLYNTLDTINWMAIDHDEIEISNMISLLGSILRYSVSNIDILVSLQGEIEWIKKYTTLQSNRFNGSFKCLYEIDEKTVNFPIYKMLMQPIIENAIMHGFENIQNGGLLCIKTSLNEEGLLVTSIRDNGCGMSPEQLERIRNDISDKTPLSSDSIGISNTINRLELYYHGKAQMEIDSELGQGTQVILIIPYEEDKGFGGEIGT